ncbi:MAG TPA: hypothetical protein VLD67_21605 [Vicinamibacterales bacterium]|nr:hypothetical protein [Vicinamibacterales bacterium]
MRRPLAVIAILAAMGGGVLAQEKPAEQAAKKQAPAARPAGGLAANIRIELAITDEQRGREPLAKTVSMVVAEGRLGRIRTARGNTVLNVDANPSILRENRMLVTLTLEYRPEIRSGDIQGDTAPVSESITAILDDGKPLVISQSADPSTDRTVKVEVKATILR